MAILGQIYILAFPIRGGNRFLVSVPPYGKGGRLSGQAKHIPGDGHGIAPHPPMEYSKCGLDPEIATTTGVAAIIRQAATKLMSAIRPLAELHQCNREPWGFGGVG